VQRLKFKTECILTLYRAESEFFEMGPAPKGLSREEVLYTVGSEDPDFFLFLVRKLRLITDPLALAAGDLPWALSCSLPLNVLFLLSWVLLQKPLMSMMKKAGGGAGADADAEMKKIAAVDDEKKRVSMYNQLTVALVQKKDVAALGRLVSHCTSPSFLRRRTGVEPDLCLNVLVTTLHSGEG
jgi:hypothetical protein